MRESPATGKLKERPGAGKRKKQKTEKAVGAWEEDTAVVAKESSPKIPSEEASANVANTMKKRLKEVRKSGSRVRGRPIGRQTVLICPKSVGGHEKRGELGRKEVARARFFGGGVKNWLGQRGGLMNFKTNAKKREMKSSQRFRRALAHMREGRGGRRFPSEIKITAEIKKEKEFFPKIKATPWNRGSRESHRIRSSLGVEITFQGK